MNTPFSEIFNYLAKSTRKIRKRIASAIEPKGLEPDPDWDFRITTALRCAKALREKLTLDESTFLFVSGFSLSDPRQYIIYTALDEVKKTALYLMRLQEVFLDTVSPSENRIARLLTAQILEEARARERRLLEVLVSLILFESTNEKKYYRHLLLLEDLEEQLSANYDFKEFYGSKNANFEFRANQDLQQIKIIENDIDFSKAWYLKSRTKISDVERLKPGQILSSIRSRIIEALPIMTDAEKLIFGFSYGAGYGRASEFIHYTVNTHDYKLREGDDEAAAKALGVINYNILERCFRLMGKPDVDIMTQLSELIQNVNADQYVHLRTVRDIDIGDFVLAYGDLGEVFDISQTKYGYRSYKVKYLAEKPLPNIQEDWFPAFWVKKFYTQKQARENLLKMVDEGILPREMGEKMNKLSNDKLQPHIRDSLIQVWESGLRDWVKNQQENKAKKP